MTTSQESGGASRVTRSGRHASLRERAALGLPGALGELAYFEMGLDEGQARLDAARHKSEDYELRAKAAESTLACVRDWAEDDWFIAGDQWFEGYGSAQRHLLNIIDGKTK